MWAWRCTEGPQKKRRLLVALRHSWLLRYLMDSNCVCIASVTAHHSVVRSVGAADRFASLRRYWDRLRSARPLNSRCNGTHHSHPAVGTGSARIDGFLGRRRYPEDQCPFRRRMCFLAQSMRVNHSVEGIPWRCVWLALSMRFRATLSARYWCNLVQFHEINTGVSPYDQSESVNISC